MGLNIADKEATDALATWLYVYAAIEYYSET